MNQRGFTLVELMIGMLILLIILSGIASMSTSLSNLYLYTSDKIVNTEDHRYILGQISNELRLATKISPIADKSKIIYESTSPDSQILAGEIYLDTVNHSIVFKKNSLITNISGKNCIQSLEFILKTPSTTNKREVTINMLQKGNNQTFTTKVITLNDISN